MSKSLIKFFISLLFIIVLISALYFWLKGDLSGQEKIKPGKLSGALTRVAKDTSYAVVEEKEVPVTMEAVGTIFACHSTDIAAKIMATINKIYVSAGDEVQEGQLLVELDDRDIKARLNQAKKELEAARASEAQAEADANRHKDLFEKGVASRQVFEQYETALKVARARVEQAQETVKEVEVMLSYTKIYAPFAGRITEKLQNEGDMAMPGRALLKMYNPDCLRLEAAVPESLKSKIINGARLPIRIDAINYQTEGTVEEIVPSADISSRTFIVKVRIPPQEGLYEGMFGRLIIPVGSRKALVIPRSALYMVGQVEMVKIINERNELERRVIKTGKIYDGMIEVLSGLNTGDKVIVGQK